MKTKLFFIALVFIALAACNDKDDSTPASLTGTWKGGSGISEFTLVMNDDNTYDYSSNGATAETGSYSSTSTVITFTASAGFCSNDPVDYNYACSETILDFTNVDDNCVMRSAVFNYDFTRQ